MDTMKELHDFLIAEYRVPSGSLAPDENLLGGILDSMGLLKLITHLEWRYGFETADEDFVPENFATLEKLCAYVERRKKV